MRAQIKALCSCQVVAVLLLVLAVIISVVGCATSSPHSYLMAYGSPYEPGGIMPGLRIEHNLLNNKYQRQEQEDLADDWHADGPLKSAEAD
jgi:hypothetical protein